jgi:hypothetical protein
MNNQSKAHVLEFQFLQELNIEIRTHKQFINNVIKYEKYEDVSILKICKLNNVKLLDRPFNKFYDFSTTDNIKYEVKSYSKLNEYDNIPIEFQRKEYKTGISITISDYYIITDYEKYYLIKTSKLKELCFDNDKIIKTKYSYCWLINKEIFINNSILI